MVCKIRLIVIRKKDYINDILDKVDYATLKLFEKNFKQIILNKNNRKKQREDLSTYRKLRDESNSLIDWNNKSDFI